jgi:hypothetical protein
VFPAGAFTEPERTAHGRREQVKEDSMFVRRIVHTLCAVGLLAALGTSAVGAMTNPRRTTYFTFSGTVRLPGVSLPAGTYVFEVANPDGQADIVRVLSRDRKTVHLMKFTRFVYRTSNGNMKAIASLGETPAGTPPPVTAWYPHSETRGREFIY